MFHNLLNRLFKLYMLGIPTVLDKHFDEIRSYITEEESRKLLTASKREMCNCVINKKEKVLYFISHDLLYFNSHYFEILRKMNDVNLNNKEPFVYSSDEFDKIFETMSDAGEFVTNFFMERFVPAYKYNMIGITAINFKVENNELKLDN